MMTEARECTVKLRQLVSQPGASGFNTHICTVESVSGTTCNVKRILDNKLIKEVSLNTMQSGNGIVITPKIGSVVFVTNIDATKNFVSMFSEIEKITFKDVFGFEIETGNGSISFRNKTENLQKILVDFINEVAKIIVIQGTSPDVPALMKISQRLQNLLK